MFVNNGRQQKWCKLDYKWIMLGFRRPTHFYILILYPFCAMNFTIPRDGPAGAQQDVLKAISDNK